MIGNSNFGFSAGGGAPIPPSSTCWSLNGNTVGSQKYFGTNDNFSIPIYTNGVSRGVFDNSGNFGFGISAGLTARVHVKGIGASLATYSLKIDDSASSPLFYVRNDGNVGVGIAVPTSKLYVAGVTDSGEQLLTLRTTSGLWDVFNVGQGTTTLRVNNFIMYGSGVSGSSANPNLTLYDEVGGNPTFSMYSGLYTSHTLIIDGLSIPRFTASYSGRMWFNSNVGVGIIATLDAKLWIKGVDSTSSNFALKVDNSTYSFGAMFSIANDFRITASVNPSSVGASFGHTICAPENYANAFTLATFGNSAALFSVNIDGSFAIGHLSSVISRLQGNGTNLFSFNGGVSQSVGINVESALASLHIKGASSDSAAYAFKVDDLVSAPLLYVQNNGFVGFGVAAPNAIVDIVAANNSPYAFSIRNNTHTTNNAYGYKIYQEDDGRVMNSIDGVTYMTISVGGSVSYSNTAYISPSDTKLITQAFADGAAKYSFYARGFTLNNGLSVDGDGNVGINQLTVSASKLQIKGLNALSTHFTLKLDDSASTPLFYVRNDGKVGVGISTPLLRLSVKPTGNLDGIILQEDASNFYASFQKDGTKGFLALYDGATTNVIFNSPSYSISDFINTGLSLGLGSIFNAGTGALGQIHVYGVNATTSINQRLEPVLAVTQDTTGNTVGTTDATSNVTAQTISVATNKVLSIESTIVYRKTAGAGVGTIGDGTTLKLNSSVKNVGGTLTLDTVQNTYTGTVNAIIGATATYTISGTNVLVSVTGVLNDNITWNVITKINTVG